VLNERLLEEAAPAPVGSSSSRAPAAGREISPQCATTLRSPSPAVLPVRSGVDCLIAVCALRRGLTVVHRDRDFAALATLLERRV
jgi:predicted nucleic acid-binding protein